MVEFPLAFLGKYACIYAYIHIYINVIYVCIKIYTYIFSITHHSFLLIFRTISIAFVNISEIFYSRVSLHSVQWGINPPHHFILLQPNEYLMMIGSTLCHTDRFACHQMMLKHYLALTGTKFPYSSLFYLARAQPQCLMIWKDGGLSTVCNSSRFACQQISRGC